MDIVGSDAIATRFAALTATAARHILVDLVDVDFLASIGIRSLISNAKAVQQRGGRMVLLVSADSAVAKTLETTGVDALIPMFTDPAAALAAATL
jgi:anti-anti-sigma factor